MNYNTLIDTPNTEEHILDAKLTEKKTIEIISNLTGIDSAVLKEAVEQYSLIEVIENPLLLNISTENRMMISDLHKIITTEAGVEYQW